MSKRIIAVNAGPRKGWKNTRDVSPASGARKKRTKVTASAGTDSHRFWTLSGRQMA